MRLTLEELKQYLIDNCKEEIVGFGKRKITAYTLPNYNVINAIYVYQCYITIKGCESMNIFPDFLRYNKSRDVIQFGYTNYWNDYVTKWKDITDISDFCICTDKSDVESYKDEYLTMHYNEFAKLIYKEIKECDKIIRKKQKEIKMLRELESNNN